MIVEWIGKILDTAWPPETWVLLLAARLLNLVILSAILYELSSYPRRKFLKIGLYSLWTYFLIRSYINPVFNEPLTLSMLWLNTSLIFVQITTLFELRKVKVRVRKKRQLRQKLFVSTGRF